MTRSSVQNIAIVGAGIMGRVLGWQLLQTAQHHKHHLQLSIYDKDPIDSGSAAAYTAAGMLTPYSELESAESLIFDMGMQSLSIWPEIAKSLPQDIHLKQDGSLVLAHANDKADYLRFLRQLGHKLNPDSNSSQSDGVQQLQQAALGEHCPQLAETFSEAVYLPEESSLNSQLCMQALGDYLRQHNVIWHEKTQITTMGFDQHGASITIDGGAGRYKHVDYDKVIDCRGLAAKPDMKQLRGVRGELIWLHAPDVYIDKLVRLVHPRYRIYLVPRENHIYLLGATQIESEDSGDITVRSVLELLSAAYSLHPAFAEARVIKTAANCRPALRDNLPRIETQQRLMRINGLFRHGYLLAPVLAKIATNQLLNTGETTVFDAATVSSK